VKRIRRFVQEAVSELRKVTWPTGEQTRNLTVLVFVVSLAIGAYVLFWDQLFQAGMGLLSRVLG
jgi:preprotein translocase SecE subunit